MPNYRPTDQPTYLSYLSYLGLPTSQSSNQPTNSTTYFPYFLLAYLLVYLLPLPSPSLPCLPPSLPPHPSGWLTFSLRILPSFQHEGSAYRVVGPTECADRLNIVIKDLLPPGHKEVGLGEITTLTISAQRHRLVVVALCCCGGARVAPGLSARTGKTQGCLRRIGISRVQ